VATITTTMLVMAMTSFALRRKVGMMDKASLTRFVVSLRLL
jgi:hypothetical protein